MTKNRPVNLDLSTIHFPVTAIASILHRVSGVVLFFGMAILLAGLGLSLSSEAGFAESTELAGHPLGKLVIWGILTALAYHLIGGLRHLIMDFGFWEELQSGTLSAQLSFVATALLAVLAGVWLW